MKIFLSIFKLFPPELSHSIALNSLNILYKLKLLSFFKPKIKNKNYELFGLNFKNKLGTAAGLDKNGDFIDCLGGLGFGFLEVGTVTPLPQTGNPKPRVFRLFKEQAVINRLGFNNKGVDHLVKNLKKRSFDGVVGVNIGANKDSKGQRRIDDYLECLRKVSNFSDYVTINISSPNTPGLRDLHNTENIKKLIFAVEQEIEKINFLRPVFLKISPDESFELIQNIAEMIESSTLTGLIISNTTLSRDGIQDKDQHIKGGLSGAPLMNKSTKILNLVNNNYPNLALIGVGGVMSKSDFDKKIQSGASLVQIYTGFIIKGPKIVMEILK
ncbi:quinone-dependent dihydroorotate dehydrogenase [Gammaproteobacteria bacterium]|nr:quinone-dependent dihydroorotate dehydrogenase [Gammaproteobacteria bacterium]MDC3411436.1 quinone-dependent dihydroorotate dehydrogenase [Gammaproteobacteria bacterium]